MTFVIFAAGLAAITAGCALLSVPLGLIVGGALAAGTAWALEPGDRR